MITEVVDDNKVLSIKLNQKQINQVLESLLYAGSINIGATWDDCNNKELIEIAISIKDQLGKKKLKLENLTFFEDEGFEDENTDLIKKTFDIEQFTVKNLESI